jgi:hypothetical protein
MRSNTALGALAALAIITGCHQDTAPHATAQDIEAAKQEVQSEVAKARVEASKDIKSAAKVTQSNPRDVLEAKATGKYDVAMVQADGDHTVAIEKCLTLQAAQQPACKQQADAAYETAKGAAKAARLAQRQSI